VDPGDLEHNRRGLLGPGQRAQIEAHLALYDFRLRLAIRLSNDSSHVFLTQLRQSLADGRVVAATGEVGMDLPAFRAGIAEQRLYDLPGNFEPAYFAALDEGGHAKLASWLDVLPGRYAIYRAMPVGVVVGVERLAPPDHAQRLFGIGTMVSQRRLRVATRLDVEEGRIEAVDGPLVKSSYVIRGNSVSRRLEIGHRTFDINDRAELYAVLIPGFVYRAYFAPRSGQLLAIELLPQEDARGRAVPR
jgi:hypothetical protein